MSYKHLMVVLAGLSAFQLLGAITEGPVGPGSVSNTIEFLGETIPQDYHAMVDPVREALLATRSSERFLLIAGIPAITLAILGGFSLIENKAHSKQQPQISSVELAGIAAKMLVVIILLQAVYLLIGAYFAWITFEQDARTVAAMLDAPAPSPVYDRLLEMTYGFEVRTIVYCLPAFLSIACSAVFLARLGSNASQVTHVSATPAP